MTLNCVVFYSVENRGQGIGYFIRLYFLNSKEKKVVKYNKLSVLKETKDEHAKISYFSLPQVLVLRDIPTRISFFKGNYESPLALYNAPLDFGVVDVKFNSNYCGFVLLLQKNLSVDSLIVIFNLEAKQVMTYIETQCNISSISTSGFKLYCTSVRKLIQLSLGPNWYTIIELIEKEKDGKNETTLTFEYPSFVSKSDINVSPIGLLNVNEEN